MKHLAKNLAAAAIAATLLSAAALAADKPIITSKQQADAWLAEYCIILVDVMAKAVEKQKTAVARKDWKTFFEQGDWIGGVSGVYANLCDA